MGTIFDDLRWPDPGIPVIYTLNQWVKMARPQSCRVDARTMDVHRFIIKAYPREDHPEFHVWQKATLVMFVANPDPYAAEQNALDELSRRCWVPEEFEHRDTLIREAVQKQGGEVWEAYVQAEQGNLFWLEDLESLPMCKKGDELWGAGPRLTEAFVDILIQNSGGHRLTAEEAGEFREKNADYVLGKYVLELKHFENEGLSVRKLPQ